jgi:LmbE family N-acetylglucosaminyl deacetylase
VSGQNIAVVVAHPDDEVLAFGGTICRRAEEGDIVHVLFLATGLAARMDDGIADPEAVADLRGEAKKAAAILGVADMQFCDFPDNRMDTVALLDVVKRVQKFVEETESTIVYTHHDGDLNIDHAVTARAVLTACRPVPGSPVRSIYAGEILSSSEHSLAQHRFRPSTYIGIEPYIDKKRLALQCYTGEVRYWPHPRSVEAVSLLAQLRGSECGLDAAEALYLVREVQP